MRKKTWFAVVVCTVLVVPASLLAGYVALVYRTAVMTALRAKDDPPIATYVFGDTPSQVLAWILVNGIGSFVQGYIAGMLAAWITRLVYRGERLMFVAVVSGGFYVALMLFAVVIGFFLIGANVNSLLRMIECFGILCGTITVAGRGLLGRQVPRHG